MKIKIYDCLQGNMKYVGYIEVENDDSNNIEEYCFNLCNWINWSESKPENLFSEISNCNHGICFYLPNKNIYCLALSVGWLYCGDKSKIEDYAMKHKNKQYW